MLEVRFWPIKICIDTFDTFDTFLLNVKNGACFGTSSDILILAHRGVVIKKIESVKSVKSVMSFFCFALFALLRAESAESAESAMRFFERNVQKRNVSYS